MSYIPEPDPTPLRLRLGARSEHGLPLGEISYLGQDLPADADEVYGIDADIENVASAATLENADLTAEQSIQSTESLPHETWSSRLDTAIAETDRRVERWVADQQKRLVAGLDLMLAQLKEERQEQAARLEAWKISERQRVERELAREEEQFHKRLLDELQAFEEQLALRLCEQEERLARWWDEAERYAERRFADLGLSPTKEAAEPPTS